MFMPERELRINGKMGEIKKSRQDTPKKKKKEGKKEGSGVIRG
jgi:hypothetical protein